MSLFKFRVAGLALIFFIVSFSGSAIASSVAVGAAPKGNASEVASRIIKYNFPACKKVENAKRKTDGSITATCNRADFLVFTVFNPREGRTIELAMNCTAAKQRLDISCR